MLELVGRGPIFYCEGYLLVCLRYGLLPRTTRVLRGANIGRACGSEPARGAIVARSAADSLQPLAWPKYSRWRQTVALEQKHVNRR